MKRNASTELFRLLLMSPSVFAIYLLHQPEIDFEVGIVRSWTDFGCNIYIAYLAAALAVFFLQPLEDARRLNRYGFQSIHRFRMRRLYAIHDALAAPVKCLRRIKACLR